MPTINQKQFKYETFDKLDYVHLLLNTNNN